MKCIKHEHIGSHIDFVPLSDVHIGDYNCDKLLFQDYIDWIRDNPNALTFLNGDMVNVATTASKSSVFDQEKGLSWQIDTAVKMLYPIKDKIIGCITGNHEERLASFCGFNPTELIATRLQIPYLGYSGVIDIKVQGSLDKKAQNYIIYAHHTTGGGGHTPGGKINRVDLMRKLVSNADVYIGSHNHHLGVMPVLTVYYKAGKIRQQRQLLVDTGSFLKWNGSYAEFKQLPPAKLGAPKIRLDGLKHDIHCSI